MLDVISFVTENDGRLDVDTSRMYPAALAHVQDVLSKGIVPGAPLDKLYLEAEKIPEGAWKAALNPPEECSEKYLTQRAMALEISRLWFTELLHLAMGGGTMHVHLIKDERFKLSPRTKPAVVGRFLGYSIRKE